MREIAERVESERQRTRSCLSRQTGATSDWGKRKLTKVRRLKYFLRPCTECKQPIPSGSKICPSCKAPLTWRRFVTVSQTTLALLIALTSVVTTLLNVGVPLLKPSGSAISVLFSSSANDEATFVVKNGGRSGGIIQFGTMTVDLNEVASYRCCMTSFEFQISDKGNYVEPDREMKISIPMPSIKDKFCTHLKSQPIAISMDETGKPYPRGVRYDDFMASVKCSFTYREPSFHSKVNRNGDEDESAIVKCTGLPELFSSCVDDVL